MKEGVNFLLLLAIVALVIIGGAGFTVWYNYSLAVPVQNSERYVQTCNTQYLVTQKAKIDNDLDGISNINSELADPSYSSMTTQLKAQQKQDARDIYNALDASQCSKPQIVKDMSELQDFFTQFPTR